MINLYEKNNKKIIEYFMKNYQYKNPLAVPRIEKIVINSGIGREQSLNPRFLKFASQDIVKITGQKPKVIKSSKAISGFKLKTGMPIGLVVNLRNKKMYDFLNRLIHVVLPRIRDFRGLKEIALDQHGNLNIGISEHTVFPEIKPDEVIKPFGLQITIVTTTNDRKIAKELFRQYGFIFEK